MKRVINDSRKLIRNGGRKAIPFSEKQLKEKIFEIARVFCNDEGEDCDNLYDAVTAVLNYGVKKSKVYDDISKIDFSQENLGIDRYDCEFSNSDWLGFHTAPSGFSYLGCIAGGDGEIPVSFAIYFDGKVLRGYIPQYYNTYNIKTKAAFGADWHSDCSPEEELENYLKLRHGEYNYYDEFETKGLFEDIESRVQVK